MGHLVYPVYNCLWWFNASVEDYGGTLCVAVVLLDYYKDTKISKVLLKKQSTSRLLLYRLAPQCDAELGNAAF